MTEYVMVPRTELAKLEAARVKLHSVCESVPIGLDVLMSITDTMWYLANRKWEAAPQQAAEPVVITLGKGDKLVADIFADDSGGVVHKAGVGIFDPTPGTIYGVGVKDTRADGLPITADRNPLVLIWSDKPESLQVIVDELQESIARLAGQPPAQPHPWAPNRFEYDRSIHSNPDAKAWADLFVQTFPGLADKHDLMVTWFANAMMAMHDHLQRRPAQPEQPAPIPTSERLPTGADADHDGLVLAFTKFTKEWVLQSRLHVHDNPGAYTHWQPTGLTRPAAPDSGGCAVTAIDELNRQRAERHRLVDAEYDERIRLVQERCQHERNELLSDYAREFWGDKCKHCGAVMNILST